MNRRTMTTLLLGLALVATSSLAPRAADDPKEGPSDADLRQMQGEWTAEASERDGQAAPPSELASLRRKVTGNTIEIELAGQEGIVTLVSEFTIDPSTTPKTLDVVRKDGPSAGVATLAIYEFVDGRLRICNAPPGQPRPTSFNTMAGTGLTLTVWRRAESVEQGAGTGLASGALDTRALDLLRRLSEHVQKAESLQTSATFTTTIQPGNAQQGDQLRRFQVTSKIAARRPGHFSFQSQVDGADKTGLSIVADGERLVTLINDRNVFTQVDGETSLSDVGQSLLQLGHVNTGVLFANLLSDDPYETLLGGVSRCVYGGIERLEGAPCHYLRFKQDRLTWELWVAAEGDPLVRKLVSRTAPNADADGPTIVTVEEYRDWKLNDAVTADEFQFAPPPEAKRVDEFRAEG